MTKTSNLHTHFKPPVNAASLTPEQLNKELEKGYLDMLENRTKSAIDVFNNIRKDFNL